MNTTDTFSEGINVHLSALSWGLGKLLSKLLWYFVNRGVGGGEGRGGGVKWNGPNLTAFQLIVKHLNYQQWRVKIISNCSCYCRH